jgi:transposase
MRRHQLTDEQWVAVEPLIPRKEARTGRPPEDPREMLDGILWVLRTGAPWRDLPERFGPWQTVYDYFSAWRKTGVFDRVLEALQIRLDRDGKIDWDLWCIDGANVRAARCAAGAGKKVVAGTRVSRPITRWAAAAADSGASSIWSLTAAAFRWPPR